MESQHCSDRVGNLTVPFCHARDLHSILRSGGLLWLTNGSCSRSGTGAWTRRPTLRQKQKRFGSKSFFSTDANSTRRASRICVCTLASRRFVDYLFVAFTQSSTFGRPMRRCSRAGEGSAMTMIFISLSIVVLLISGASAHCEL